MDNLKDYHATKPVVIALIAIVARLSIANISSLVSGKKRFAPPSALPMRPATANPQQVSMSLFLYEWNGFIHFRRVTLFFNL